MTGSHPPSQIQGSSKNEIKTDAERETDEQIGKLRLVKNRDLWFEDRKMTDRQYRVSQSNVYTFFNFLSLFNLQIAPYKGFLKILPYKEPL